MKKTLLILLCLVLPAAVIAQERTGNITGTVIDLEGNILPGVSVTLTGQTIAPITTLTSAEGKFRFLSLFPSKEYEIKLELQGFKTKTSTNIVVNVGVTADLKLTMDIGKLEEQITVVAQTPVVQAKKTQVQTNINYEQLQSLPSARDPWVVLQLAPSIMVDRENIGGTESGQQSGYAAKGGTTQEWTLDGMQITDRSSISSPSYWDFDMFEEMQISTGMLDVEHRDSGIVVNLVTRRGGNKTTLGGRFYWTSKYFQNEVSASKLAELKIIGYNHAVDLKDFGFNAGGALIKDKVWWWGAYGVQQIQTLNMVNVRDDTYLNNYSGKLNFQLIPENRAEITFIAADKIKYGRSSSESFPAGFTQGSKFKFGNPTFKFQDEHMFGDNVFVSVRVGKSNPGFGLIPGNDSTISNFAWYDVEKNLWKNTNTWFYSDRPHPYGVVQLQYFNDDLLGTKTSHEMKIGFEYNNNKQITSGGWPGNFYVQNNFQDETLDWNRDGSIDVVRDLGIDLYNIEVDNNDVSYTFGTDRVAAYFSDTVNFGRFNLNLGIRTDHAKDYLLGRQTRSLWTNTEGSADAHQDNYPAIAQSFFTQGAIDKITSLMPVKNVPDVAPLKTYWFVSPRLGLTYDVFGTGKTIAKIAYSLYPGGYPGLSYTTPYGAYPWTNFWWVDGNGNKKADFNELYWRNNDLANMPAYRVWDDAGNFQGNMTAEYGDGWGGWDPANPQGLSKSTSYLDVDNWKTSLTNELFISVEHEVIQDFGVSLSYTWKRAGRFSRNQAYYPLEFYPTLGNHIRSKDDYEVGGTVPNQLVDPATGKTYDPKDAAGRPWYVLKNIPETLPTSYSYTEMMDPDRHNIYWGFDLVLNKRLSNKWMMNGSLTYQMERQYYGSYGYNDPTTIWAYEGAIYGIAMGGTSGKINREMFSRWMVKLTGLYQLPLDINLSGTVSGHEGSFYAETFGIRDLTLPNTRSNSNSMPTASYNNRQRLPDVWVVNLKLEKMVKLGDASKMYLSIDLFNTFNSDTLLRQYDIGLGTFRVAGTTPISRTSPAATSGVPNEMMNPFIFRLGLRFQM